MRDWYRGLARVVVLSTVLVGGVEAAFLLTPEEGEIENSARPVREAYALLKSGDVAGGVAGFLEGAEGGDADAQFAMGYVSFAGVGVEKSPGKAIQWYRKAAEQGHIAAQVNLANVLFQDEATQAEGVVWLKQAANKGSNRARVVLAESSVTGKWGVEKDWKEAERYLVAAAESGEMAGAGMQLAQLYDSESEGWEMQSGKSLEWLNRLVGMGETPAMVRLGDKYYTGTGVEKSTAKGKGLYEKAAAKGDANGYLRLAGVAELAKRWEDMVANLEKAGEAGNGDSFTTLGQIFEQGKGVEMDLAKAAGYYGQGADAGVVICMHNLGVFYDAGKGVDQTLEIAAGWFFKAAVQGLLESQNQLAAYYRGGRGVMRDPVAAAAWFDRASRGGHVLAQVNLASMFEAGEGVGQDFGVAAKLYQEAAQRGLPLAMARLGVLLANGRGVQQDKGKAHALLVRAGEQGIEDAKANGDKLSGQLSAEEKAASDELLVKLRSGDEERKAE
ncbi:MAG: tetratricopeptide repeat protein [Verrucomicrobiales bacterium]|nr:tetratricopeptide repeat protein [Verrucomicrobiales bacterium]